MGIVVSCANLATIYHNTKYSGGKVVNYLHISWKCLTLVSCCLDFAIAHENGYSWCLLSFGMRSGCVRDALGMHLERVRHLTICRTMEFFLACLKSATKSFNVLLASKRPLITELSDKLRQKYPLSRFIGCAPLYCIYSTYKMMQRYEVYLKTPNIFLIFLNYLLCMCQIWSTLRRIAA